MQSKLPLIALLIALLPGFIRADEAAVRACTQLVMDYAVHRDNGNAEAYAALFAKNASLSLLGDSWQGREAILERMRTAPAQTSLHLMSTVRIQVESPDRATGVSYAEVYIEPAGELPLATQGFAAIGRYHDRFERTDEGWRIAERRFERVLVRSIGELP